jgi:hypothetical protein
VVLAQAGGFWAAAMVIGTVAAVLGLTHHEAWVVVPAGAGAAVDSVALAMTWRRYRRYGGRLTAAMAAWWLKRGIWLMFGGSLAAWAAGAVAVLALTHHRG